VLSPVDGHEPMAIISGVQLRGRALGLVAAAMVGGLVHATPGLAQPACPESAPLIGQVTIERLDVFDTDGTGLVGRLDRTANTLHIRTREHVVRRELLFREGEPCRDETLAQTERNPRALGIFQSVDVIPPPAASGRVDVRVRVRDAWSLRLSGRYQRMGGVPIWDLGLSDTNIGGEGFATGIRRRNGFDADISTAWLDARRLAGSRERLSLRFDDRSDGRATAVSLSRPFYALDARWAHEIGYAETRDVLRVYQDGENTESFGRRTVDAVIGLSARLATPSPERAWRAGFGYQFVAREHATGDIESGANPDAPPTHRWAGPYASLQFIEHRFVKRTGLVVPQRVVDLNLGTQVDLGMFVSQRAAAWRTTSRVILGAGLSRGWMLPGEGLLVGRAGVAAHTGGGEVSRAELTGLIRGWWQRSATHVLTAMGEVRSSINPEAGYRLYLGGSPGLRAFREYAYQGTRTALVVIEDRKYANWTPAGLAQFGGALFLETGAVGGAGVTGRTRILADAGIGLRIAMLRSSASSAIRIDAAFPLTPAPDGRRRPQLVIGYRSDF
jgi:outer membrane protein assembly factor BamA